LFESEVFFEVLELAISYISTTVVSSPVAARRDVAIGLYPIRS